MQLTLLTLNLAGFKNWKSKEAIAIKALDKANADILLLQEVMYDAAVSPYSQANYINPLLEHPYQHTVSNVSRFYAPSTGEPYREGLAMLSRFPLQNPETLALNKAADDKHTRMIQTVDITVDGTAIGLVNVHFSNNKYSSDQLKETLDILSARGRSDTTIIAGDFNIFNINDERALFDSTHTTSIDAASYISFPSENATFDYILLPKAFRFLGVETLDVGSDHLGIFASISD